MKGNWRTHSPLEREEAECEEDKRDTLAIVSKKRSRNTSYNKYSHTCEGTNSKEKAVCIKCWLYSQYNINCKHVWAWISRQKSTTERYRPYSTCEGHTTIIWHWNQGILFAAPVWCNSVNKGWRNYFLCWWKISEHSS